MISVLVVPADGEGAIARLDIEADDADALRAAVGGWLELVILDVHLSMFVDEEGALKQLAINERASFLAGRVIMGPAVVVGTRPGDPDIHSVPPGLLEAFDLD